MASDGIVLMGNSQDTTRLLRRAANGDEDAAETLLSRFRSRLRRMVQVYFDQRMAARIDPSDIVQETLLEAHRRLPDYLENAPVDFYVWLRAIARDRLIDNTRRHIKAQRRSVAREVREGPNITDRSVQDLAKAFLLSGTSPTGKVERNEELARLRGAFYELDSVDREVLTLRYVERTSAREAGEALGISENAFTKRHIRAIARLKAKLDS